MARGAALQERAAPCSVTAVTEHTERGFPQFAEPCSAKKRRPEKGVPTNMSIAAAYFSTRQSIGGISFSIKNLFTLENTREPKNPL